jgi:hypothetical protein
VLKKLLVAVLACLTIFLSKRALTDSQPHSVLDRRTNVERDGARDGAAASPAKPMRTAVLY